MDTATGRRTLIAILILLILISLVSLFLLSIDTMHEEISLPVDELRSEIAAKSELHRSNMKSEHDGYVYLAIIEKARAEKEKEKQRQEELKKEQEQQIIQQVASLEYIPNTADKIEDSDEYKSIQGQFKWSGPVLNATNGSVTGPSGKETYYNLPMGGVVAIMRGMGNRDKYWVRSDGCKMLGNYIMVAANLQRHARGSIVECSRGYAIVCDTGTFAKYNVDQLDLAVNW